MDAYTLSEEFYRVTNTLMDAVRGKLECDLTSYEISNLRGSDLATELLLEFMKSAVTDEKTKTKLVNQISKNIMSKHKDQAKKYKDAQAKNLKLWNATKGKIPCLMECGYTEMKSKVEVLKDSNTFICKDCAEKLDKEKVSFWKIFETKNVYKIFNI